MLNCAPVYVLYPLSMFLYTHIRYCESINAMFDPLFSEPHPDVDTSERIEFILRQMGAMCSSLRDQ